MIVMLNVVIPRDVKVTLYKFTDFFKGFEKIDVVREVFWDETEKVLNELKVEFFSSRWGYMGVCGEDGHIMVSVYYLKHGDERDIYLDVIHELVHVKQFMEGKELFDDRIEYVDRSTEIEAYQITVKEARRIRMTDDEIFNYLKANWMSSDEVRKLARTLGVKPSTVKTKNDGREP